MALPAAMLIGGGISALFNWLGAKKQASAAEQAAQAQMQATDRAAGMMNQAYAPYLNAGAQSMNVLGRLMTPGVPYSPELQAQDAMAPPMIPGMGPGTGTAMARVMTPMDRATARRRR